MSGNITEISLLEKLRAYHDQPFTVESVAAGMDVERQAIAPYFTELVSLGLQCFEEEI